MATKTMTRVQALAIAIRALKDSNVPQDVEAVEVLKHMGDQLTKPKAASTAKSKTAMENEATAHHLYAVAPDTPVDSAWVMAHSTAITPQKVVGIMRAAISLGLFEKAKDGKRTVYRKVG